MAAPFALTYIPPLPPVPDWLSYRIAPTATVETLYTVQTLDSNGIQTALVGEATLTRYGTTLLQLPVTVSLQEVGEGQSQIELGQDYTTAGGMGPTVARVLGGTEIVTIGTTEMEEAQTPSARPTNESTRNPNNPTSITNTPSRPTSTMMNPTSTPQPSVTADSARTSAATASSMASLPSAQASLSSLLASASIAGQTSLVSSLSSELSEVSSAASESVNSITASSQSQSPTSDPNSSLPPTSSVSPTSALSPSRLSSLTPPQLAAAIATPICFFFLALFLILLCCFLRRKRKRDRSFEGLAGGAYGDEQWDWVEPRVEREGIGSRLGGFFRVATSSREGSRANTPMSMRPERRDAGEASWLAGGGRLANEHSREDRNEREREGEEEEGDEDVGASMMMTMGRRTSSGSYGRRGKAPTGLGIAAMSSNEGGGPSLPERAAATLNAGLRQISGGRLGGSPRPEGYAYEAVELDLPDSYDPDETFHSPPPIRGPYWDPYKPSPTTPEFPILAPSRSNSSSEAQRSPEYSGNSTSPDTDDVRRANMGLADLTNEGRWSGDASPRTDGTLNSEEGDDEEDEEDQESTEMLASSREDQPRRQGDAINESNWLSGRPPLPPPLLRVPSDLSLSQYSQSDVGVIHPQAAASRMWLSRMWLPAPERGSRDRSRENSGGSVASDLSMGGNDKLSLTDLFFTAPRWTGARNPHSFPTSTISPIIPSGLVSPAGNLTPPLSSSSSSVSSSKCADAPLPISHPSSSATRQSFHTPLLGAHSPTFTIPKEDEVEESPMVYTPAKRRRKREARPGSGEVLDRIARSFERERAEQQRTKGGEIDGKRRKEWTEMNSVEEESRNSLRGKSLHLDAPFSNLTPLSSPLLPPPSTPPLPPSRHSSSSLREC